MRIRSRLLTKIVAVLGVYTFRALYATCRVRIVLEPGSTSPYGNAGHEVVRDRQYLFCVWHDQLVTAVFSRRGENVTALVSQHQDGSYLADAMTLQNVKTVRGSTTRGGVQALRQLIEATSQTHVVITPDGPKGPRRELKSGIVFLASHAGRSIIPVACDASRAWRFPAGWSDLQIPKPFSRVIGVCGTPIPIPTGIDREGLAAQVERVTAEMARVQDVAARLARGEAPLQVEQPTLRAAA